MNLAGVQTAERKPGRIIYLAHVLERHRLSHRNTSWNISAKGHYRLDIFDKGELANSRPTRPDGEAKPCQIMGIEISA